MALQVCVEGVGVIEGAEICTLENMSVPWRPLQRGLLYSKVLRPTDKELSPTLCQTANESR